MREVEGVKEKQIVKKGEAARVKQREKDIEEVKDRQN